MDLLGAVQALLDASVGLDPVLEARAESLAERLSEGAFRIAVCGGFSNGKSTLINALVGAELLPIGVLPVTAIATEVIHGPAVAARVELANGGVETPTAGMLGLWVSEEENPDNTKDVVRVTVTVPSPLLEPGVTLIDTPGLESIFEHNDTTAMATIREAEGALVVLSADAPLTAAERRLLDVVAERSTATFFALNRADHLSESEVDQAVAFVSEAVEAATGVRHPVFATSARSSLQGQLEPDGQGDAGMTALTAALGQFVDHELVEARQQAFAVAVRRLADDLADADELTTATSGLALEELMRRITQFEQAADAQRHKLAEDTTLLAQAVKTIDADLAAWLAREGRLPVPDVGERFAAVAAERPLRQLEGALDQEVQALVEARFDELRPQAVERVEKAWDIAANDFVGRVQARADAIRAIATETFGARLRPVPTPAVAEEPDRFWYLFFRPELPDAPLWRALRLLLPHPFVRHRLLTAAQRRLADELDKHAGRARSEISTRLAATHRRFVEAMTGHVEELIASIERATERARNHAETASGQALVGEHQSDQIHVAVARARAATARAE